MLAAILHVAFRLHIKPSEVMNMTQTEFALCIAHMQKHQADVLSLQDG